MTPANASTALATVLVDELVRGGVQEAVLSPGSRSAPLAYALHEAEARGLLRLHVRIDERTAGFLALGLAKASGLPVPVITTSGTATANLHPAVLEASVLGVPDPRWDEEVRAVIALRRGATATEDELRQFLRGSLAGYKIPKRMVFMDVNRFPKSPAGKVVKTQLRKDLGW